MAGADLAHVGPQFGDAEPLVAADLARVAEGDREMLELACAVDAEGFYRQVLDAGNWSETSGALLENPAVQQDYRACRSADRDRFWVMASDVSKLP